MTHDRDTLIGRVVSVAGSTISVRLEPDLAGVAPLWRGRIQTVGQVGTLIVAPQGATRLLAVVSQLELAGGAPPDPGDRFIQAELIGEISGSGTFERGVSQYPGIGDPIHFVVDEDVDPLFPRDPARYLSFGRLASNPSVEATLDLERLVSRHSAVVGSTGSGKSSTVAAILQSILAGPWPAASVTIVDSHGEYGAALSGESVSVLDLASDGKGVLPYWVLGADDLLEILDPRASQRTRDRFRDLVTTAKEEFATVAKWISLKPDEINFDTPIPYSIHAVWFRLDCLNRQTFSDLARSTEAITTSGTAEDLVGNVYQPNGAGAALPNQGPEHGHHGTTPDQIRRSLQDPANAFLLGDEPSKVTDADPLPNIVGNLFGIQARVNLIDVSRIASFAARVVVAQYLSLAFDMARRATKDGIGRDNPMLIVIDEAHRYFDLPQTRATLERISREGRKHGIGIMLVTQRPHELPATSLSQVGTMIALRLNNASDQGVVAAAMPDGLGNLIDALPSLRNGEAIVAGESIALPSRVLVNVPNPWPNSHDPSIKAWAASPKTIDLETTVANWRRSRT